MDTAVENLSASLIAVQHWLERAKTPRARPLTSDMFRSVPELAAARAALATFLQAHTASGGESSAAFEAIEAVIAAAIRDAEPRRAILGIALCDEARLNAKGAIRSW